MAHGDSIVWLAALGLSGIFFLALAEKLIPMFPSYAMLMFLGSTVNEAEALVALILTTTSGSVAGALVWYWSGRLLGAKRVEAMIMRLGKHASAIPLAYRRLGRAFRNRQFRLAFVGQVTPVVRVYSPLFAGALKLDLRPFLPGTSIGCCLWNLLFLLLGYSLPGHDGDRFAAGFTIMASLVCAEFLFIIPRRRTASQSK